MSQILRRMACAWLGSAALLGCGPALQGSYTRLGTVDLAARSGQRGALIADDVRIYEQSLPPGLSLTDAGVSVQPERPHLLLGEVAVTVLRCDHKHGHRHALLRELQRQAFAAGGNALVWASVELPEVYDEAACERLAGSGARAGHGWAVLLMPEAAAAPE